MWIAWQASAALRSWSAPVSAEGECVCLNTGIEKVNLEGVIGDLAALAYQLIQPLPGHDALPLRIDVRAVAIARRCAVDGDAKPHRLAVQARPKHQVQIPRMEPIHDTAAWLVEHGVFFSDRPISRQRPLVETGRRGGIDVSDVFHAAAGRYEVFGLVVAYVCLRRCNVAHVGRRLGAGSVDRDDIGRHFGLAGFGEKSLYGVLRLLIVSFAEMVVAYAALGVDEVMRRPILVVERAPDGVVVIDRDRIIDLEIGDCGADG